MVLYYSGLMACSDGKTDPFLYDRLVRRFQSSTERKDESREKGYSGTLEADIMRSEAKVAALAHPDLNIPLSYKSGPNGEILAEEQDEIPITKEEGQARWRKQMELRFLKGEDDDFDYSRVDQSEEWDDMVEERRVIEDRYFGQEKPNWISDSGESTDEACKRLVKGETGIQDF